jgi:hypothetical protein
MGEALEQGRAARFICAQMLDLSGIAPITVFRFLDGLVMTQLIAAADVRDQTLRSLTLARRVRPER